MRKVWGQGRKINLFSDIGGERVIIKVVMNSLSNEFVKSDTESRIRYWSLGKMVWNHHMSILYPPPIPWLLQGESPTLRVI